MPGSKEEKDKDIKPIFNHMANEENNVNVIVIELKNIAKKQPFDFEKLSKSFSSLLSIYEKLVSDYSQTYDNLVANFKTIIIRELTEDEVNEIKIYFGGYTLKELEDLENSKELGDLEELKHIILSLKSSSGGRNRKSRRSKQRRKKQTKRRKYRK
jgi:uncharacterized protein YdiU (UPF0061 family)